MMSRARPVNSGVQAFSITERLCRPRHTPAGLLKCALNVPGFRIMFRLGERVEVPAKPTR